MKVLVGQSWARFIEDNLRRKGVQQGDDEDRSGNWRTSKEMGERTNLGTAFSQSRT